MWGVDVWLVFQWHLIKVCDVKILIDNWGENNPFIHKQAFYLVIVLSGYFFNTLCKFLHTI